MEYSMADKEVDMFDFRMGYMIQYMVYKSLVGSYQAA